MTEKQYARLVDELAPKSPKLKDYLNAFWIGGAICLVGQLFMNWYKDMGLDEKAAGTAVSMTLVTLSALLTGFSLAITAPAVEFKTEGFILGVGAKMFTIAGPVIVYGVSASIVYGLIYWITTLF